MRFGAFQRRGKELSSQIRRDAEVKGAADKSLGNLLCGESSVDCRFLNANSKWGLINNEPTGLLAIKVTFAEHPDYKLRDVILTLQFLAPKNAQSATASVYITEDVKSMYVCGQTTESHINKHFQMTPEVNVGSIASIKGLGADYAKEMLKRHRWIFLCHVLADLERNYTRAQLVFQGNPDVEQVDCVGPIYAGLALVHDRTAFKVCVAIEGKVRRGRAPFVIRDKKDKSELFDTTISPRHENKDIQGKIKEFEDWLKERNIGK